MGVWRDDRVEHVFMNTFTTLTFIHASDDRGAVTVEYAIATVAAAAFAGLLAIVLKSGSVQGLLMSLISSALSVVTQ
jgi:hypothetical protein